jgi:SAM-dependent methyltransferase
MREEEIRDFWQARPCGDAQVGGLWEAFRGDYIKFFEQYDSFRYSREGHILRALDRFDFRGKEVLEIGLGQGADSEQLIRRGAVWSGLDLAPEAVDRVRIRAQLHNLPLKALKVGTVLDIPFSDGSFDIVFSHGVLHHVPEIRRAQREMRRVLRPHGSLIIMLYAKNSLNYHLAIRAIRRAGLVATYTFNIRLGGIYDKHLENAKKVGLLNYLRMKNFIHRSTDGPENPYSKVYTLNEVRRDFPDFKVAESIKLWMHAPPLPVHGLPGEKWLGWHLWVRMLPRVN